MRPDRHRPPRQPLHFALPAALRRYSAAELRGDLLAGLTVGVVAIPLGMALAIAIGVPPQHGLYTVVVAGLLTAALGGSAHNISGPTAAFVVILLPIVHQHGLGGLLLATMMSGLILLLMGLARLGRFVQYIPYPVTTGFTAGIGVVIATLQLKDLFGLDLAGSPEHYLEKVAALAQALPGLQLADLAIGLFTLAVLLLWPRLRLPLPGHLVALLAGTLVAALAGQWLDGFSVATIGSRFSYTLDGVSHAGIPPLPPMPLLPWSLGGADGQPLTLDFALIRELLPSAFAIAALGAIESLLCATVADGLADTRHDPNAELIGQGLGNLVAPLFGGITATAAIARTATNIRAGGRSPVAAMVHALVVLAAMLSLAGLFAWVPMATLAAILLIVAWNMSEAHHFVNILRVAPRSDVAVLLTCFSLTVLFDMVLAVGVGFVLAALLFIHRVAELSDAEALRDQRQHLLHDLPESVAAYAIRGPLFFGAAEKTLTRLRDSQPGVRVMVIEMEHVPVMDMTGLVALKSLLARLERDGICVILCGLSPRIARKLRRAGLRRRGGVLELISSVEKARDRALSLAAASTAAGDAQPQVVG